MNYEDLTFKDDKLNRKSFVENIMSTIESYQKIKRENESVVLAMDSPWGTGKSYLISMWRNWLLSKENKGKNYAVAYYNAWEEDDCENAFVPLVYKLQNLDVFKENKNLSKNIKKKAEAFAKSCGIALFKDAVKKIIGDETAKIFNEGIDSASKEQLKDFFEKYQDFKKAKGEFREGLQELVPVDGKLIVFVDELDRCRPDFAIQTLEVVKHYFNIQNIVFIFSVDLEQLSHSISTMYGQGMDSAGYLRRFFDINIRIPDPDKERYIEHLFKPLVEENDFPEVVIKSIKQIYEKLDLSLRDMNKITDNFIVFYLYYIKYLSKSLNGKINYHAAKRIEIYIYFMVLKYKYPREFKTILTQKFVSIKRNRRPESVRDDDCWVELDNKFYVTDRIVDLLNSLQVGVDKKNVDLINLFGIEGLNNKGSFAEHIENTLEMFE